MASHLRLGIDGLLIRRQGKGVSRFLLSFLRAFACRGSWDVDLRVFVDEGAVLPDLPRHDQIRYLGVRSQRMLAWDLWGLEHAMRQHEMDVVLTLSDRVKTARPYVLYLFEIPDYRMASNKQWGGLYQRLSDEFTRWYFPTTVQRAAHIVASSAATKSDVVRLYGVGEGKVSVVYPAPDSIFCPPSDPASRKTVAARLGAGRGYILHFSSNNDPRDNTEVALQSFANSLHRWAHGRKLVIGGVNRLEAFGWDRIIDKLGLRDKIVFAGFLSGQPLVELYQAADVYLDPSLYEGFGFQVAEAMACGTPVVCSNVGSLPEIVGDAGRLAAPTDTEEFAGHLAGILADSEMRERLSARALQRIQAFSWPRCVDGVLAAASAVR